MEKICGIYRIENLVNHKIYIGLSKDCMKRWHDHRSKAFNSTREDDIKKPLYMAMRKYGLDNFTFEIIEKCDEFLLKEREIYWISYYDSYNKGYNATKGGDLPEGHILKGEEHGCAKLTEEQVRQCRVWYAQGRRSRDVYENEPGYKEKVAYSGFQNMWHGRTWKHIMPEVFENKIYKKRKLNDEQILKIRELWFQGVSVSELADMFKEICSHTTISDIVNNKRFSEIQPNIQDNHISRRKLTDEEVRQIRKWKAEGKLNKEIRELLNNKVSMTTISDILTGKRYSEIK